MGIRKLLLTTLAYATLTGCSAETMKLKYTVVPTSKDIVELVEGITKPEQAQKWLNTNFTYEDDEQYFEEGHDGSSEMWVTFGQSIEHKKGDCDDYALAAAAMLEDNVEEDYILGMYAAPNAKSGHAIYVYKMDDHWGSIGNNHDDFRLPRFDTIEEIVMDINENNDNDGKYHNFALYNIDKLDRINHSYTGKQTPRNAKQDVSEVWRRSMFTLREGRIFRRYQSVEDVQNYLETFEVSKTSFDRGMLHTFATAVYYKSGTPFEIAKVGSVLLNNGSYPFEFLQIWKEDELKEHAFIVKEDGLYGSVSHDPTYFREPQFHTKNALVNDIVGASKFVIEIDPYDSDLFLPSHPFK